MNVSIVVPVYNEGKIIDQCLDALIDLNYDSSHYEIIVVNDASTDKTLDIIKKSKEKADAKGVIISIIDLPNNSGRVIARETGARAASYQDLFFVDSRCIAEKNILNEIERIGYNPIIGNPMLNKDDNFLGRFIWLSRRFLYKKEFFNDTLKPVFINKENFDKIGKGLGMFFCDKDLFLSSQLQIKDKNSSDDIKIFENIVRKKDILRHPNVVVRYVNRDSLMTELNHTFNRGPKFVDYYLNPKRKFFWFFIFSPQLFFTFLVLSIFIDIKLFVFLFCSIVLLVITFSALMSVKVKDFLLLFYLLPLIGIAFEAGILKGIILKLFQKY